MDKIMDYAKIAVIAWVGIFVINKGLKAVGMGQYSTNSGSAN